MNKIRIGKDFDIRWSILTNGEAVDLDGRDLHLEMQPPFHDRVVIPFNVEGNTIVARISHNQQESVGTYGLTLWENYGKDGQTAVDSCKAFTLVSSSCAEDDDVDSGVNVVETIELETGDMTFVPTVIGGGVNIEVDAELSDTSENPVQNKVVTREINTLKNRVQYLTQAQYDALTQYDSNTLYVIVE